MEQGSFTAAWRLQTSLPAAACSTSVKVGPEAAAGLAPDGTIDMRDVQVPYQASGGGGNDNLFYQGSVYPFTIGGLGVGGIEASTIIASGEVYKLDSLARFPGAYRHDRDGVALGNRGAGVDGRW